MEETNLSIQINNDETLNESKSLITRGDCAHPFDNKKIKSFNNYQNNNNHDNRQPSIHDDITSPFPKHQHELEKQQIHTKCSSKVYDQTDFARPVCKTSLTLIETADKLKHFKNQSEFQVETSIKSYFYSNTQDGIIPTKSYSVSLTQINANKC